MPLTLPRLPQEPPSHSELQVWWQQVVEAIEAQEAAQDETISDLEQAIADIRAVQKTDAISGSYTVPTEILTQTDNTTNVTIGLAAHTRYYGDGTSAAVSATSITVPYGPGERGFYYDNPNRTAGAVTLQSTTDLKQAQANYANGRHALGTLEIITAGSPPATGGGMRPPGNTGPIP